MEREACVCDHGFERSDLCVEIIIIIIITVLTVTTKISNYQLLLLLHTSITELSVLRNACLGGSRLV